MERKTTTPFLTQSSHSNIEVDTLGKFAYNEHRQQLINAYAAAGLPTNSRPWEHLDLDAQKRWEAVAMRVVREFLNMRYPGE